MEPTPEELIRRWCEAHRDVAMWDAPSSTLFDVGAVKSLPLDLRRVAQAVAKQAHGEPYVVLVLDDGRQLALAPAGIAFPPLFDNSGPLAGMPQVVCFRDFVSVVAQVEHVLAAHPDEKPGRELLDMLRYCIALCDGARAIGFSIDGEERRVERLVAEVERRAGQG